MVDRFRAFLDRPLDPSVGRAVLALAAAVTIAFVALFLMVAGGDRQNRPNSSAEVGTQRIAPAPGGADGEGLAAKETPPRAPALRHQDPQDEKGSVAAANAQREIRGHRALQHVPYRRGGVSISLVGARRSRAVLRISAPTEDVAHRGWRWFLHRYGDSGTSYLPVFRSGLAGVSSVTRKADLGR